MFTRVLKSNVLKGQIDSDVIESFLIGSQLGITDLVCYKELFEKELENEDNQFIFKLYTYPLIYLKMKITAFNISYPLIRQ